jgi:hypothetical protein
MYTRLCKCITLTIHTAQLQSGRKLYRFTSMILYIHTSGAITETGTKTFLKMIIVIRWYLVPNSYLLDSKSISTPANDPQNHTHPVLSFPKQYITTPS